MLALTIRPERPDDHKWVRALLERAFPTPAEARLVDALRAARGHEPDLCLVAEDDDGEVVGHIFYSRARLQPSRTPVLALAPMAVVPEHQRKGVGGILVRETLRLAGSTEYPLVVIAGHARYYPRFGAEPAGALGIEAPFPVPPESWLAVRLLAYRPEISGTVEYHPAFSALA